MLFKPDTKRKRHFVDVKERKVRVERCDEDMCRTLTKWIKICAEMTAEMHAAEKTESFFTQGLMASSRRAVLEADAVDLYNRRLGTVLAVAAVAWAVWAFGLSSGRLERLGDGTLVSFSRDAGLKMTPRWP